MTEIKLDHAEFIEGIRDNTLVPWVDINKGHALLKTQLAPMSWRISVKLGTYLAIMLIPSAIILFFFLEWWTPSLMILVAIVLIKTIRGRSKKGVIKLSILQSQFYELAISTDTLILYSMSTQSDRESGNTITGVIAKGLNAQSIINSYAEALAIGSRGVARPISYLANTQNEIRQAYKDYLAALKQQNKLDDKMVQELRVTFGSIDHFIDDKQAHIINRVHEQIKQKIPYNADEEKIHRKFVIDVLMDTTSKMKEFDELLD